METTITTTVKNLQVFVDKTANVRLFIADKIDGYVASGETTVKAEVDYVYLNYFQLVNSITNKDFAFYLAEAYNKVRERKMQDAVTAENAGDRELAEVIAESIALPIESAKLAYMLNGATIEFVRTEFNAGDEYSFTNKDGELITRERTNSGYTTEIVNIELATECKSRLATWAASQIFGL